MTPPCGSSPCSISPGASRSSPAAGHISARRWPKPWETSARRCTWRAETGHGASALPPSSARPAWTLRAWAATSRSRAEVDALVARVGADRGRLDVMVCNAGGAFTTSYLPDASIDELRQALELNVTGTYVSAQAAARAMIPRRQGRIITLGSIHGSLGADNRLYAGLDYQRSGPPYQAAKGAVVNLTRALATELGPHGITVNCLSPGQIPQPGTDPTFVERCRLANPLSRTGTPTDLKGAVALLASDAGAWITGHNLVVDGGWSVW